MPPTQGAAPGRVIIPPSFRYLAARAAAMELVQTLCFHIMSAFLMNSTEKYFINKYTVIYQKKLIAFNKIIILNLIKNQDKVINVMCR